MSEIYILKNQNQAYLDKNNEWITSGDRKQLFRTLHKDEALNMRVEWAVKHPEVRIEIASVALDEKGLPTLDLPRSEKPKEESCDIPLELNVEEQPPIDQLPLEQAADLTVTNTEEVAEIAAPENQLYTELNNTTESGPGQINLYPETNQPAETDQAFTQPQELTDV